MHVEALDEHDEEADDSMEEQKKKRSKKGNSSKFLPNNHYTVINLDLSTILITHRI